MLHPGAEYSIKHHPVRFFAHESGFRFRELIEPCDGIAAGDFRHTDDAGQETDHRG